jgi:hypothetical protein
VFGEGTMMQRVQNLFLLFIVIAGTALPDSPQIKFEMETYFTQNIGLSQDQITGIRAGKPVAMNLKPRTSAEIFVFGAIYINATPDSYLTFASDLNRLRKLSSYLGVEKFSNPPQLSDLKGFDFGSEDVKSLKKCKPSDCEIQLPASTITAMHKAINWSASDVDKQVNQFIQKLALQRLLAFQKEGNRILGAVYNDKEKPTNVAAQFKYMLSYSKALPKYLPDFYHYLLNYPDSKPANVDNMFRWENVKFGLKPTLRIVQVITLHGNGPNEPSYAIAEKQLYSSHYFETALNLTFCISDTGNPKHPGFYLIMVMGSEQAGLTGFKGSIIRRVAVGKSVSSLQNTLTNIKNILEHTQ